MNCLNVAIESERSIKVQTFLIARHVMDWSIDRAPNLLDNYDRSLTCHEWGNPTGESRSDEKRLALLGFAEGLRLKSRRGFLGVRFSQDSGCAPVGFPRLG